VDARVTLMNPLWMPVKMKRCSPFLPRSLGAQGVDPVGHAQVRARGLRCRHPLHRRLLRLPALPHAGAGRGAGSGAGRSLAGCLGEARHLGERPGDAHQALGPSQVGTSPSAKPAQFYVLILNGAFRHGWIDIWIDRFIAGWMDDGWMDRQMVR